MRPRVALQLEFVDQVQVVKLHNYRRRCVGGLKDEVEGEVDKSLGLRTLCMYPEICLFQVGSFRRKQVPLYTDNSLKNRIRGLFTLGLVAPLII